MFLNSSMPLARRYNRIILAVTLTLVLLLVPGAIAPVFLMQREIETVSVHAFGSQPLSFERNAGQVDPSVHYVARSSSTTLYFTAEGVTFSFVHTTATGKVVRQHGQDQREVSLVASESDIQQRALTQAVSTVANVRFIGANPDPSITSGAELPGKTNYLLGNVVEEWQVGLSSYEDITYAKLYPGISLKLEGTGRQLKGTYTVAAGADPTRIRWTYMGARDVSLTPSGDLQIALASRVGESITLVEQRPVAWQVIDSRRHSVHAEYKIDHDDISIALGAYDPTLPLIIDPTVVYATFLGGSGIDMARSTTTDGEGNVYVTGNTTSLDFPTANAVQSQFGGDINNNGLGDVFVTKLDANGVLVYSTYLGGLGGQEFGDGIAVDDEGRAHVTGDTNSSDFPIIASTAYQPNLNGVAGATTDAFITRLSADGTSLDYSTYLGGSSRDGGSAIALDNAGNAYLTGITQSPDFPTVNPFQPSFAGGSDAFITKLSPDGSELLYSTFLGGGQIGGSSNDWGSAINVDPSGSAYVGGTTGTDDFPTLNPIQSQRAGSNDAFISRLSADGSALLYSTYFGGTDEEIDVQLALDTSGNIVVAGRTSSSDLPTVNAVQPNYGGGRDAFAAKLTADGTSLIYVTYLGGSSGEFLYGLAVDPSGNTYLTGSTDSADFPTVNSLQPFAGGFDVFVTKLSSGVPNVLYSTFLGGGPSNRSDVGFGGIAVDAVGNVYISGFTKSLDFPTTNASQGAYGGGQRDAFIAKIFDPAGIIPRPLTALAPAGVWVGLKNSDAVGIRFDLLAEVYANGNLVTSGQLDSVHGGSSGFNNARFNLIPFDAFSPVAFPEGSEFSIKISVRNTCFGPSHNSGMARLWYNDASANSRFGATINQMPSTYYLLNNFLLGTSPGNVRKTIDVAAGSRCSPFKPFGTWSIFP